MNFLLTGKPGSGKSTLVQELINELQGKKKIAAIITPEIREQGIRRGFKIIDLATGREAIMAHVSFPSPKVGKYGVSVENIDSILQLFEKSFDDAEIIVIDEIGKMESCSKKFIQLIEKIFNSNKTIVAVIGIAFLSKFKQKGKVIVVERNSAELLEKVLKEIEET